MEEVRPVEPSPTQTPNPSTATQPIPPQSKKRRLDNVNIQNSQYFKMRAVLTDLRPHFIEVQIDNHDQFIHIYTSFCLVKEEFENPRFGFTENWEKRPKQFVILYCRLNSPYRRQIDVLAVVPYRVNYKDRPIWCCRWYLVLYDFKLFIILQCSLVVFLPFFISLFVFLFCFSFLFLFPSCLESGFNMLLLHRLGCYLCNYFEGTS